MTAAMSPLAPSGLTDENGMAAIEIMQATPQTNIISVIPEAIDFDRFLSAPAPDVLLSCRLRKRLLANATAVKAPKTLAEATMAEVRIEEGSTMGLRMTP